VEGAHSMGLRACKRLVIVFSSFVLLLGFLSSPTANENCLDLSFKPGGSDRLPQAWKPLTFPKIPRHTSYTLESDGKTFWVKAESRNSASALVREIKVDPKIYPILRWRWRVENVIQKGDERKKQETITPPASTSIFATTRTKPRYGNGHNTGWPTRYTDTILPKAPLTISGPTSSNAAKL
jgi:hypothetical protein